MAKSGIPTPRAHAQDAPFMPEEEIWRPQALRHVQVLDADGQVDEALDPGLDDGLLRRLYRAMVLVRHYDEARLRLQRQGEIGTFAPCTGQEAAQLGTVSALRGQDWFVPSFRELAAAVWRGGRLEDDLLYCAGYEEGINIPDDAKDLPIAIPVSTQIPHAAGIAWASKLRGLDEVTMCYVGDGGTSEGDFHEGLNFAGVYGLPMVTVIQNNHWAISVPRARQTASKTLAQKAHAYGIDAVSVDGNDLLACHKVAADACRRARDGDGATLIEAVTYRMGIHTTADDPTKYRDDEEVDPWKERDPITRLRTYLEGRGIIDEDGDEDLHEKTKREVKEAIQRFRDKRPDTLEPIFDHHMEQLPAYIADQKEALLAYAERAGLDAGGD